MAAIVMRHRAGVKPGLAMAAWAIGTVSVACFAAAWVLAALNRDLFHISADFAPDRFLVAYCVVGAVVAARRPHHPVGWLLLGIGLVVASRALVGEYALRMLAGLAHPAPGVWAAWYVSWSLGLIFPCGLLMFLLLLFPSGRPLSARWWKVVWFAAAVDVCYILISWLGRGTIAVSGLPVVANPTGVQGLLHVYRNGPFGATAWAVGVVCLLAVTVSAFIRYRRSAGEERLQLKWFAYAAVLSLILLVALVPAASTTDTGHRLFDLAVVAGIGLALPLAIGIAVLKYRLYAIDRIISRSVSYAVVTGLVVGIYVGCVVLLTDVLPVRGSVGVAVAVLVAAALFNPLRRRVQGVVDRRFDRARYDADRVVAEFAVQLREQVDLDVLGADLLGVVQHVLAPEHLALWLNGTAADPPASEDWPAADPGGRQA